MENLFRLLGISLIAVFVGLLPACASKGDVLLRQNLGDRIITQLHIGMTKNEVDVAIGKRRKYLVADESAAIQSEEDFYDLYRDNYYPKDFLQTVDVGTSYRLLSYWTNYAGRNLGVLLLFFDTNTQQLRGWVNTASELSLDKFMHERLTSKLHLSGDYLKRMRRNQVHALIGLPAEVIVPPKRLSRQLFEDHFWISDSANRPPTLDSTNQIDVYEYRLENGTKRRVYVAYTRANERLIAFGYDQAWEEAERYMREQARRINESEP